MRDSKRQKVYNAETRTPFGTGQINADEAQQTCDLLSAEFDVPLVTVRVNTRMYRWGGMYSTGRITLPRNITTLETVLHEFAHHLDGRRLKEYRHLTSTFVNPPSHGATYLRAMLDVTAAWFGKNHSVVGRLTESYTGAGLEPLTTEAWLRDRLAGAEKAAATEAAKPYTRSGWIVSLYGYDDAYQSVDRYAGVPQVTSRPGNVQVYLRESAANKAAARWHNYGGYENATVLPVDEVFYDERSGRYRMIEGRR